MELNALDAALSVCKVASVKDIDLGGNLYFIGRTDGELSLVCRTEAVPAHTVAREDGWRAFRVQGQLDFSLIGILAGLTAALAEAKIGVFAVSTYDTDYILVKAADFDRARAALTAAGHTFA